MLRPGTSQMPNRRCMAATLRLGTSVWVSLFVRYSVVNSGKTSCVWVANPSDGNWGRSSCEQSQPIVACVTSQLDQNIDAVFSDHTSHLLIWLAKGLPPLWNQCAEAVVATGHITDGEKLVQNLMCHRTSTRKECAGGIGREECGQPTGWGSIQ